MMIYVSNINIEGWEANRNFSALIGVTKLGQKMNLYSLHS